VGEVENELEEFEDDLVCLLIGTGELILAGWLKIGRSAVEDVIDFRRPAGKSRGCHASNTGELLARGEQ
jgi:hypothetical protein